MRRILVWAMLFSAVISAASCSSADEIRKRALNYKNNEFGFSLRFNEKWESYRVFDAKEYTRSGQRVRVFYVCLPTRSRDWQFSRVESPYAVIFSIYVYDNRLWEKYNADDPESAKDEVVMGRSDKYVFVLGYPSGLPVDLYLYMKEIDSVARTFRVGD